MGNLATLEPYKPDILGRSYTTERSRRQGVWTTWEGSESHLHLDSATIENNAARYGGVFIYIIQP